MTKQATKCPHCGSTSTLPIAYGLISDEAHQENTKNKKWTWGGCKFGSQGTDYCKDCGENFGEKVDYSMDDCIVEPIFQTFTEYYLDPKNRVAELYEEALARANGDEKEAEKIYKSLIKVYCDVI